jgi:hypothetical protein
MSVPGGPRSTPGTMPLRHASEHGRLSGRSPAAGDGRRAPAGGRSRPRLTARGSVLLMVAVFLIGNLIAVPTQVAWLGGPFYAVGCLLAVAYTRREALLMVVTAPPLIFLSALVGAELITAGNNTALATAEGTILTLAAVAPWLFGCTIACLIVGLLRGLPRCVRDLRAQLNGRIDAEDEPATAGSA